MTKTFFTSTRSRAPAITPLFRYACALGASCVLFHVAETFVKARSCRYAACDSLVDLRETKGLEARETNDREEIEGMIERNWPGRAGARRARRPQRAIAGGQAAAELQAQSTPRERYKESAVARNSMLQGCKVQLKAWEALAQQHRVLTALVRCTSQRVESGELVPKISVMRGRANDIGPIASCIQIR